MNEMNETPEQRDELIESIARRIVACGLETPAIFFLEMNKPVAFITGQSGLVFAPWFGAFFGIHKVNFIAETMSERENVERLIQRIEELAEERKDGKLPAQAPLEMILDEPKK